MKASLLVIGRGSAGRGAAIVAAGCVVVFIAAGVLLSQPTVAVGLCIGWVIGLLAFGMGARTPEEGDR